MAGSIRIASAALVRAQRAHERFGCVESTGRSKYSPRLRRQFQPDMCVICLDFFQEDDTIAETDCKHTFHAECIQHWFNVANKCPVCRSAPSAMSATLEGLQLDDGDDGI